MSLILPQCIITPKPFALESKSKSQPPKGNAVSRQGSEVRGLPRLSDLELSGLGLKRLQACTYTSIHSDGQCTGLCIYHISSVCRQAILVSADTRLSQDMDMARETLYAQ